MEFMDIMTNLFENLISWLLGLPLVGFTLSTGIFFTIYFKFPQLRLITHTIKYLNIGEFNKPKDKLGELNQYEAFCTSLLSSTGFASIISTILALSTGGLGAIFWMWLAAFIGMSLQFSSVSLSMLFRTHDENDERVRGGPMDAIINGLPKSAHFLAYLFAIGAVLGALFSGNLYQAHILSKHIENTLHIPDIATTTFLAILVFFILRGGIKRIGRFAGIIVPLTLGSFILCLILILMQNINLSVSTFGYIFKLAFSGKALLGGTIGFIMRELINEGARRTFLNTNIALGTSSIGASHANARPVGQGIVSMLIPFIDVFIVSTLTAIVITTTSSADPNANPLSNLVSSFESHLGPFGLYILNIEYFLMAFMVIVGWGFCGMEGMRFLVGKKAHHYFLIFFSLITLAASFLKSGTLMMISNTALTIIIIPNLLMCIFLSGALKKHLKQYDADMKAHRF